MASDRPDVLQITSRGTTLSVTRQDGPMAAEARGAGEPVDPAAIPSDDDRDVGWGGRDWADRAGSGESGGVDPDLERLLADRPPHHEERER